MSSLQSQNRVLQFAIRAANPAAPPVRVTNHHRRKLPHLPASHRASLAFLSGRLCVNVCVSRDDNINTDVGAAGEDTGVMLEGDVKPDAKSILHT